MALLGALRENKIFFHLPPHCVNVICGNKPCLRYAELCMRIIVQANRPLKYMLLLKWYRYYSIFRSHKALSTNHQFLRSLLANI